MPVTYFIPCNCQLPVEQSSVFTDCDSQSVGPGRSFNSDPLVLASEKTDTLRSGSPAASWSPCALSWDPPVAVVISEVPLAGLHEVGTRFSVASGLSEEDPLPRSTESCFGSCFPLTKWPLVSSVRKKKKRFFLRLVFCLFCSLFCFFLLKVVMLTDNLSLCEILHVKLFLVIIL